MSTNRTMSNFIRMYGKDRFLKLVQMLRDCNSGPAIAKEFEVTRQRVNQWKKLFGTESKSYTLKPEIEEYLISGSITRTRV